MSTISRDNIKRLLGKTVGTPDESGDMLTYGTMPAATSGYFAGKQGVSIVGGAGGLISIGLGAITPPYVGTTTAVVSNRATASGLSVTGGASLVTATVTNQATASGLSVTGGASMVTAAVTNGATISGLIVTQSATFNKVTPSGEAPATLGNAPSGVATPNTSTEWLQVTVNGNTRYIPLFGA